MISLSGAVRDYLMQMRTKDEVTGFDSGARAALDAFDRLFETTTRPATHAELVRSFQEKFGHLEFVRGAGERPRWLSREKLMEQHDRMLEELKEFKLAVEQSDFAGVADSLVDLDYFALGTANMLGLPWTALFLDVHRANMEKEPGAKVREGKLHKLDAVKPQGWRPPKTMNILIEHGYDARHEYDEQRGEVAR